MLVDPHTPVQWDMQPISFSSADHIVSATVMQQSAMALGAPFAVDRRGYRIAWERDYRSALLMPVAGWSCHVRERDKRDEKRIASQLSILKLGDRVTLRVPICHMRSGGPAGDVILAHARAGGLIQIGKDGQMNKFRIQRDVGGAACWIAVSESRWPLLRALWDFLRRLTLAGQRAHWQQQEALRWLSAFHRPGDPVASPAARIAPPRSPLSVQAKLARTPFALHAAVHQSDIGDARRDRDADGKTVAHHIATLGGCDRHLVGTALDVLFSKSRCPLNLPDNAGDTAVHLAVRNGDPRAASRFVIEAVRAGFDFTAKDSNGKTVGDYLAEPGRQKVLATIARVVPRAVLLSPDIASVDSRIASLPDMPDMPALMRCSGASPGRGADWLADKASVALQPLA